MLETVMWCMFDLVLAVWWLAVALTAANLFLLSP
jgi:hypothetical protein